MTILRVLGGIAGFFALLLFGATVLAGMGTPDRASNSIAMGAMLGAVALLFWGLKAATDRPAPDPSVRVRRHLRAARWALGFAMLVQLYLMSGLPMRARISDLALFLPLLVALAASIASAVLLRRAPRVAHVLLVLLTAWGVFDVVSFAWSLAESELKRIGPALAVAFLLVYLMATAIGYALWALRRVRPLLTR